MRFLGNTRVYLSAIVLVALALRAGAQSFRPVGPYTNIERRYLMPVATLASGYGLLMRTPAALESNPQAHAERDVMDRMQRLDAAGEKISPRNPYPASLDGLIPATVCPAGYSVTAWILYELFNYRGMTLFMHGGQILLDALACVLVYFFAACIAGPKQARLAAFFYALCPAAIFLCTRFFPDALHGVLTGAILAAAANGAMRSRPWLLVAGALIGLACHFRSEYVLLPALLIPLVLIHARSRAGALGWCAGMVAVMLVVLSPWAIWTRRSVGSTVLTNTAAGANMYKGLGEDTKNPWGIVNEDAWASRDAVRRGFESQYSLEADRFYKAQFLKCVLEYPGRYAMIIVKHRLPLALVPPYITIPRTGKEAFTFGKYRREEGLSRWGVLRKYPVQALKEYWSLLLMMTYSGLLLAAIIGAPVLKRRDWRTVLWIVFPWGYTVGTMVLIKQLEPRNLAPTLIVQMVAAAIVVHAAWDRWCRRRLSPETPA